ncbi:unnamed protein product [Arabis nemorensis]|uniref:Peroxidase n=1 Tax=Arabis nemorensis TaxID=586526 RepID=A0A565CX93_9BRAS|nr:unnamed protein product [Arabis nemorensis]
MARFGQVLVVALCLTIAVFPDTTTAQLRNDFYKNSCPNVEEIVKKVVKDKVKQTFVTIPATLRLFFHDCFVNGCDASVLIQSTPNNKAEKDHPDNVSLAGDGFDVVIKAKKALDAIPSCRNKVSCADILTLATRDVVVEAKGPWYPVELGRFDAAHTVGFAHCSKVFNRIYNFNRTHSVDPTLNKDYAKQLQDACPKKVDPRIAINIDPETPKTFDNIYFKNLQQGKGLFTSDQVLFTDGRSRPTVNAWAKDNAAFNRAFVKAMTKLGRVGVKTSRNGNIRRDCGAFN